MAHSNNSAPRTYLHLQVMASGLASLSWEVLSQIKASLALGVSAWGTALTLATTMGGMSFGAFVRRYAAPPINFYNNLRKDNLDLIGKIKEQKG